MQFDLGDTEYTDSLLLAWWFVPIDGLILAVVVIYIMSLLVFPLVIPVYFLQYLALHVLLYLLGQIYEKTVLAKRQTPVSLNGCWNTRASPMLPEFMRRAFSEDH